MKLLDEIIESLSNDQASLTDALLKTKVLLHQLGRKDLVEWVNHEVNGYGVDVRIPEYRIIGAEVRGSVTNGAYFYSDHPLPMQHLDKKVRDRFERLEVYESIAVLEEYAKKDKGMLSRPIPIEFNGLISNVLTGGYQVQSAWFFASFSSVSQFNACQFRMRINGVCYMWHSALIYSQRRSMIVGGSEFYIILANAQNSFYIIAFFVVKFSVSYFFL